ncbi:DUF3289 family protein [Rosenbergiella sp. S61]|uniref:DUF3289 family protein n=1 Tax=Rosenbergiella gaditana TaxID=2726987 RepID=A0ABS5SZK4_9GAMM|nr:DUF3289 family protein [Rosenbergiella gaditana]MBT0725539.1 DUF3289 family protein [Rosenbergiella gaditana]
MTALQFPCTIFQTQNRMDDYSAKDMRCGDLSESQLKTHFHLLDVSTRANPYTLAKITPYNQPQSMFYGSRGEGQKITRQQCAAILFDEFRDLSRTFALYSPYKPLIKQMITHMQKANGAPFRHMLLESALKDHILNDRTENSTLSKIKNALIENIDWVNKHYLEKDKVELRKAIFSGKLPKFDRFQDNFNGMGITVHDTWATHITLKSLHISNDSYRAVVYYNVQDHFGLDVDDISKFMFNQFRFFRVWFVLQRYNQFGFRPFMTNMEATVEIIGGRNESKN